MSTFKPLSLLAVALALPAAAAVARAQETKIRGFADVTYGATSDRTQNPSFGLGQFDLFVTSKLAERVSFLGESVFEYDDAVREFAVDVERVVIAYEPTHYLRVAAGKHHTPIGYWNNAYHHGALMQPTIERPLMMRFEDDGGILPIHTTGLLLAGRDISPLHLGYDFMVGNGIGSTPTTDENTTKSASLALSSQVTSELQIGANYYTDRASAGTPVLGEVSPTSAASTLTAPLAQHVAGGYAVYLGAKVETLLEYQHVTNRLADSPSHATDGYFAYGGVRLGRVVPYVAYDAVRFDGSDPFFFEPNLRRGLVGARYDISSAATVKLELRRQQTATDKPVNQIGAQAAVGF